MSTLITAAREGARARVPRFAEAAVERARLTVVPPRRAIGRTQAARTPFAVLVIAMLVAGVVGLLTFNTNMQQSSFKATALQEQVNVLTAREQSLNMELDALRDPQRLAVAAKGLGMVPPSQPAFIKLGDRPGARQPDAGHHRRQRPDQLAARPEARLAQAADPRDQGAGQPRCAGSEADTRGSSTATTRQDDRKKANAPAAESGASH